MDWPTARLFIQQSVASGLVTGSIYALLALSAVMIFKATDVPNFAGGELFMFSAILAYYLFARQGLSFVIIIPAVLIVSAVLPYFFNAVVMHPITRTKGALVNLVISTLGLAFVLKGIARLSDVANEPKSFPALFSTEPIFIGDAVLSVQDIAVLLLALTAMVAFFVFFTYSRTGRAMRAVGMNPYAAALVGVRIKRIRAMIWGLSGILSALAAILIAPKILITPDMGGVAILAFAAAIIGGFSSLPGAVLGGFIVGIVENLVGTFITSNAIVVAPFIAIILILLFKPEGLLGRGLQVKKL